MEEEFGKDYKNKAASGWKNNASNSRNTSNTAKARASTTEQKKKPSAKTAFKDTDTNNDKSLSKVELSKFVESNTELWQVLGTNLGLDVKTCIRVATEVAFRLAKGTMDEESSSSSSGLFRKKKVDTNQYELSEDEFKTFYKKYVVSQKGSYEFFLRTMFAHYDRNGDGVLQRDEFDHFLDLFYRGSQKYKGKMANMPSKQNLLRIAEARLDKNKDGVLSFAEVRDLLQVAAVVTNTTSNSRTKTTTTTKKNNKNKNSVTTVGA